MHWRRLPSLTPWTEPSRADWDVGPAATFHGYDLGMPTSPPSAVLTVLALSAVVGVCGACSSNRDANNSTESPSASANDFTTPEQVIGALDASNIPCPEPWPIVPTEADKEYMGAGTQCGTGMSAFVVATFDNLDQRSQYVAIATAGAGRYPSAVVGTTWAVATTTKTQANSIQTALGGKVY